MMHRSPRLSIKQDEQRVGIGYMTFSTQALQAIELFAANLGLQAITAVDGSYSFVFEQHGTLTLTSASDGTRTLLSLYARPQRLDEDLERRLMMQAGPDVTTQRFLSTGLSRDSGMLFAVGIDDTEMSLPTLETCMEQLLTARATVE